MRRYKVEDTRWDGKPTIYVTLHKGPYTKERILHKTGWLTGNVKITEQKQYRDMIDEAETNE